MNPTLRNNDALSNGSSRFRVDLSLQLTVHVGFVILWTGDASRQMGNPCFLAFTWDGFIFGVVLVVHCEGHGRGSKAARIWERCDTDCLLAATWAASAGEGRVNPGKRGKLVTGWEDRMNVLRNARSRAEGMKQNSQRLLYV